MRSVLILTGVLCLAVPAVAQEAADAAAQEVTESSAATETMADGAELLTPAELQTLVAPVALYPDTLLIQIFVAATEPLDIMKAERFLLDNADRDPAELEPEIEAMGWDPSVTVLATAFPEVIGEMSTHIDWTETMGTAMLAQSDDVMDAVQVMRDLAIDSGALISGEEQTVEVADDDTVVITPTDPEVVYVPQYEPSQVYYGPSAGDVIGATLLTFGTVAIIDEIFDDDDDWHGYWGCHNCGGWGGGPIINDPDIDIDIDGNVNIGNEIGLGDLGSGDGIAGRPGGGWSPDPDKVNDAQDKLANRQRPETQPGRLPVERNEGRSDQLREQLSAKTGSADISRPEARDRSGALAAGAAAGAGAGALAANRGTREQSNLPQVNRGDFGTDRSNAKAEALAKSRQPSTGNLPQVKSKPNVAQKPKAKQAVSSGQRTPKVTKGKALKKSSGGNKARKASTRGKASKAKMKRR